MTLAYETGLATAVLIDTVQAATAHYAQYEGAPDPDEVLSRGLLLEVFECAQEMRPYDEVDPDDLVSELGDVHWFTVEKAQKEGVRLVDICGPSAMTLDDFQRSCVESPRISPIRISRKEEVDLFGEPGVTLQLLAMRVIDADTRSDERLWRGYSRANLSTFQALRDLYAFIAVTADYYGFSLSELHNRNILKLSQRERLPHVVEEEKAQPVDSEAQAAKMLKRRDALAQCTQHLFEIDEMSPVRDGIIQRTRRLIRYYLPQPTTR